MVRIPTHRQPTHPGEMLLEEFLTPMGITQQALANAIHVPYQRVNEIVQGKRGSPRTRRCVWHVLWHVTRGFWMNLQAHYDLELGQG